MDLEADARSSENVQPEAQRATTGGRPTETDAVNTHTRQLIASLNEVADAIASALDLEEVLDSIVERAKRVTDTDKALLILTGDGSERLDLSTAVVRGRRQQHPQEWWQDRLEALGDTIFASHDVSIEHHPEHDAWLLLAPVRIRERRLGVFCAINSADRPFTAEQSEFLAILSAFAASAIDNARLAEQSRYVLIASERNRIARDLHDSVVQSLFSLSLGLEVARRQVLSDPQAVADRLPQLQEQLSLSMTEIRRLVYDLRPARLEDLGLTGAIEYWIHEVTTGTPVRGRLLVEGDLPPLSPAKEACLYRVAKESVSNVVKHAGADRFEVRLTCDPRVVVLSIVDDGTGFDVEQELCEGCGHGLGLRSIRERVASEDGTLLVDSAPGRGTTITVEIRSGAS